MDKESSKIDLRIRVTKRTFERIKDGNQKKIAYPQPQTLNSSLRLGSKVIFEEEGFQIELSSKNSHENIIRYIEKVENRADHIKLSEIFSDNDIKELTDLPDKEEGLEQIRNDLSLIANNLKNKESRDLNHSIEWDGYQIVIADLSFLPIKENSPQIEENKFNNTIIATPGLLVFVALVIWGWYKNWISKLWSKIRNNLL